MERNLPPNVTIPKEIEFKIKKIVRKHPDGIEYTKFVCEFSRKFGHNLNAQRDCGCTAKELLSLMPDILTVVNQGYGGNCYIYPADGPVGINTPAMGATSVASSDFGSLVLNGNNGTANAAPEECRGKSPERIRAVGRGRSKKPAGVYEDWPERQRRTFLGGVFFDENYDKHGASTSQPPLHLLPVGVPSGPAHPERLVDPTASIPRRSSSQIERLPANVIIRMLGFVSYCDWPRVERVCRLWHHLMPFASLATLYLPAVVRGRRGDYDSITWDYGDGEVTETAEPVYANNALRYFLPEIGLTLTDIRMGSLDMHVPDAWLELIGQHCPNVVSLLARHDSNGVSRTVVNAHALVHLTRLRRFHGSINVTPDALDPAVITFFNSLTDLRLYGRGAMSVTNRLEICLLLELRGHALKTLFVNHEPWSEFLEGAVEPPDEAAAPADGQDEVDAPEAVAQDEAPLENPDENVPPPIAAADLPPVIPDEPEFVLFANHEFKQICINCPMIETVAFSRCRHIIDLQPLTLLARLRSLELTSSNVITDDSHLGEVIELCEQLLTLSLWTCECIGNFRFLGAALNLRSLDVSNTAFTPEAVRFLPEYGVLESLCIDNTMAASDEGLIALARRTDLPLKSLKSCFGERHITCEGLAALMISFGQRLEVLDLSYNPGLFNDSLQVIGQYGLELRDLSIFMDSRCSDEGFYDLIVQRRQLLDDGVELPLLRIDWKRNQIFQRKYLEWGRMELKDWHSYRQIQGLEVKRDMELLEYFFAAKRPKRSTTEMTPRGGFANGAVDGIRCAMSCDDADCFVDSEEEEEGV